MRVLRNTTWIFLDEVDYMQEADFDAVLTIAGEREDIGITMSSTPTGRRGKFYQACTDPAMGYIKNIKWDLMNITIAA